MTREWVQKIKGELYWKSTVSPVDLAPVARAKLADVPDDAWVLGEVVAGNAGFLIADVLSGPYPGPDLLSRAERELSSGRPREALLELDAVGEEPTDRRRAALRIAALLALTPPAREEAEAVLLTLIRAMGWQCVLGGLVKQIGWSEALAEAAADASLRRPVEQWVAFYDDPARSFDEWSSDERFDRLQMIPPALLSNERLRAILSIGAADGIAQRYLGYVEQVRGVLEVRSAFDESAAEAFATIDSNCARRRAANQEWWASLPEQYLLLVEEYFGCAVPPALRSRWRATVRDVGDVVPFLSLDEMFEDGENWFGPELRGEVSGQHVHLVLPFAEAPPDDPPRRRPAYLALDLTRPVPGEGGGIDYPIVAFETNADSDTEGSPTEVQRVADSSTAWLASLSPPHSDRAAGRREGAPAPARASDLDRVRRTYDTVAERYEAEVADELAKKPLDRALLDAFAERLARSTAPVADVGCGPGHVAAYLAARGLPMIGVDISPAMIDIARRRSPSLAFEVGSMTALAAAGGAWAGAIAFYSIIHLGPPERALTYAELARVIRPGGWLLVAFHVASEKHGPGGVHHLEEWWDHAVDLDAHFLDPGEVGAGLAAAGFALDARLDREPIAGAEYPSRRSYLLLRRT